MVEEKPIRVTIRRRATPKTPGEESPTGTKGYLYSIKTPWSSLSETTLAVTRLSPKDPDGYILGDFSLALMLLADMRKYLTSIVGSEYRLGNYPQPSGRELLRMVLEAITMVQSEEFDHLFDHRNDVKIVLNILQVIEKHLREMYDQKSFGKTRT